MTASHISRQLATKTKSLEMQFKELKKAKCFVELITRCGILANDDHTIAATRQEVSWARLPSAEIDGDHAQTFDLRM